MDTSQMIIDMQLPEYDVVLAAHTVVDADLATTFRAASTGCLQRLADRRVCCRSASRLSGSLSGQWVLAGWVGGDKYGGFTGVPWPSVGTAPLSRGKDKYFSCAQHPLGLAGRFELEFQLPLNHKDQVSGFLREPVLVDGLGQLAHPDHLDALPGEHGPDLAERRRPDITGLPKQNVEYVRARAAGIIDRHGIVSVGLMRLGPLASARWSAWYSSRGSSRPGCRAFAVGRVTAHDVTPAWGYPGRGLV
jgi:hypothetical protein